MNDVEAQQQWNAQAGFFHGEALHGPHFVGAQRFSKLPMRPARMALVHVGLFAGAGDRGKPRRTMLSCPIFPRPSSREQSVRCVHALALP